MSTIAAISTPFGKGGIAVIRISGEDALKVAKGMFIPACGCDFSLVQGGKALYGRIVSGGEVIDDGIATVFRAPKSFTGEDTVEISCHGGILLSERVLKAAFDNGAVQAGAGEFSQRAFLNGKMSLSEAEAIIGLIDAENEEKLKLSSANASGVLKKRCDAIYAKILRLVSAVYVKLDYPEEDLAEVTDEQFRAEMQEIHADLTALEGTYRHGRAVNEGIKTAIIGKPNVGKSSLLNALLGKDRAIVTPIAGTTRDVIEETVEVGRVLLRIADTAGIRSGEDEVEKIGIERAVKAAEDAELILAVFDCNESGDEQDKAVLELTRKLENEGKTVFVILNKCDVRTKRTLADGSMVNLFLHKTGMKASLGVISAKTGKNLDKLKYFIEESFIEREIDYRAEAVIVNARQFSAVSNAKKALERAIEAFDSSLSADVCGLDLESALAFIGELDGRAVSTDVTDAIFHNFCVGK